MALCHEDTCFSHKADLSALLALVKRQHEALENASLMETMWGDTKTKINEAITAYNEWNEEKINDR